MKHRHKTLAEADINMNATINDLSYLTVVRDPIDRFLSGFLFACLKFVSFKFIL